MAREFAIILPGELGKVPAETSVRFARPDIEELPAVSHGLHRGDHYRNAACLGVRRSELMR